MVDRARSSYANPTTPLPGVSAQTEAQTCAALDTYLNGTSQVQVGRDIALDHTNVGRRQYKVTSGEVEHALDAFTFRQGLRMVRADALRGGKLLDSFVREVSPLAPRADATKALDCTREAIRRLMAITEDCYLTTEDGILDPGEAELVAARLRQLIVAAGAWLPHLDARAEESK